MRFYLIAFCYFLAIITADQAHAGRPVRCNGRVQFRPCIQAQISPSPTRLSLANASTKLQAAASLRSRSATLKTQLASKYYAKVLQHNFKRISKEEGLWTGKIQGNGNVQLQLQWYKSGILRESRPLGNIVLRNKSSSFGLRSALPQESGWSWEISAVARGIS